MTELPAGLEKFGSNAGVKVETRGFRPYELVKIEAPDYKTAGRELGIRIKKVAEPYIHEMRNSENFRQDLERAGVALANLRSLSSQGLLTTSDGINHLAHYVEIFEGYCEGLGISQAEGALLEIGSQAGCQTLIVQNDGTGEVVGLHTEEDADEYFRSKGKVTHGKRWVDMWVGQRHIQFCHYAGVLTIGAASGILQDTKIGDQDIGDIESAPFFQAADTLGPKGDGVLWANAVAFMTMDCAKIGLVEELVSKINKLPKPVFRGGYVLHMIEGTKPPKVRTLEFGGDRAVFLEAIKTGGRRIQIGVNWPRDKGLQALEEDASEKEAMERRLRRLGHLGALVGLRLEKPTQPWTEQALKIAFGVLKSPYGDRYGEWFTGLANDLVAQNDTLYVSPQGNMRLIVRKGYPAFLKRRRAW